MDAGAMAMAATRPLWAAAATLCPTTAGVLARPPPSFIALTLQYIQPSTGEIRQQRLTVCCAFFFRYEHHRYRCLPCAATLSRTACAVIAMARMAWLAAGGLKSGEAPPPHTTGSLLHQGYNKLLNMLTATLPVCFKLFELIPLYLKLSTFFVF